MEQALTLVCKIQPNDEEAAHIDETLRAFADVCTYIHTTIPDRITNVMRMQAMLYYDIRGAKNIQTLGLQVSLPRGPSLHSLWPQAQGSQKAHVA